MGAVEYVNLRARRHQANNRDRRVPLFVANRLGAFWEPKGIGSLGVGPGASPVPMGRDERCILIIALVLRDNGSLASSGALPQAQGHVLPLELHEVIGRPGSPLPAVMRAQRLQIGSVAAVKPSVDVSQIEFNTPTNLPSFDDKYQRHIGVLDTFEGA